MMKDQFANYVVQKVLETCSDQERELIMSRIKVHLNALKKYTYGKHIVARVEKLVAAGGMDISTFGPLFRNLSPYDHIDVSGLAVIKTLKSLIFYPHHHTLVHKLISKFTI